MSNYESPAALNDGYVQTTSDLTFWARPGTHIWVVAEECFYVSVPGEESGACVGPAGMSINWLDARVAHAAPVEE